MITRVPVTVVAWIPLENMSAMIAWWIFAKLKLKRWWLHDETKTQIGMSLILSFKRRFNCGPYMDILAVNVKRNLKYFSKPRNPNGGHRKQLLSNCKVSLLFSIWWNRAQFVYWTKKQLWNIWDKRKRQSVISCNWQHFMDLDNITPWSRQV